MVEEWIGNPASPDREYVDGLHLVAKNEASHWAYYGYDGHGSVRLLTDSNGSVTDTYTYDAFGILIDETHTGTPTPNDFLFAGEQFDPSLGMYNNRARYLNVATGRFWTGDTYEGDQSDPLSLHKYLYTHANPVNGIDPSGHGLLLDLLVSTAIRTTLYAATGVAIGEAVGAGDAYTRGEDLDGIFQAAKESGLLGLKVGALWQFKFVRPVIVVFGIGSGLGGTIDAIEKGNTANALYRGGFTLLGTVSIVQPRPSGGRLGSTKTRAQIERIAAILEKRGWEITGGGGRLPEEYLPPPGGGRKGGNYVDITAKKNGKVLRINTVDTLSDGVTPDAREAAAAALIRSKIAPGQHLLLIPKK